jgi:integrase
VAANPMARRRKEIGVRLKRGKYQVFARIHGVFRQVPGGLPLDSTPGERAAARERLIAEWGGTPALAGSLAADCARYLEKPEVAAMPSFKARAAHLELWCAALGRDRSRSSVTRDDVEGVLQTWLRTLKPSTVYLRRAALQAVYTVLDGKEARNPVRGTTRPNPANRIDRSLDYHTIERILAAMPDDRWLMPGIRQPSLSRLRAAVIVHTGIPPQELRKLRAHHFDLDAGTIDLPWRAKGAGVEPHRRELTPAGVAAFVALDAAGGWGTFGRNALTRAFKRAARAVLGADTRVRLYDMRHSLGAEIYRVTGDTATVGRLLGHVEGSVETLRYSKGAHVEVDRAALAAVTAARAPKKSRGQAPQAARPGRRPSLKLPAKLPDSSKALNRKML